MEMLAGKKQGLLPREKNVIINCQNKLRKETMSKDNTSALSRREFIKGSVIGLASLPTLSYGSLVGKEEAEKAKVVLFKTQDRKEGVREVLKFLDFPSVKGKRVLLKPNFNTADPTPGSTHNDTLSQLIQEIDKRGASEMTIGERSGPPPTQSVLEDKGIFELAKKLDTKIVNFEDLEEKDWVHFNPQGNHWKNGFYMPRPAVESEYVVSTCCLKTHQYGGVFTLSIKLAVGLTPKRLMRELHLQMDNAMRKMIATFLELSYDLWVNRLRADTMKPIDRAYYYDQDLHRDDIDKSNGAYDDDRKVTPEHMSVKMKVAHPYPPHRFAETQEI